MKIVLKKGAYTNEEVLIYPISTESLKKLKGSDTINKKICHVRELGDFKAKVGESCCLSMDKVQNVKRILLVGLGKDASADQEVIRRAYSIAIKKILSLKIKRISTIVPNINIPDQQLIRSLVEGIELTNYSFQKYISAKERKVTLIDSLVIYHNKLTKVDQLKRIIAETQTICKYTKMARDLVNENSDQTYSLKFFDMIKGECSKNKLKVIKLGEDALKKLKMNLIIAVNAGSDYPPLLLEIIYTGNKSSSKKIALVGKGLTFDTGGLNLKPTRSIEDMKLDMAGAASVVSMINCAANLKLKQNLVAVVPLVENMIGPKAYKPGDVFISYSKKSVEIRNTDAEGRLVLADALSYTVKKYKPELIVDLATLTGACLVALGEYYAAAMTNSQKHLDLLLESSKNTGENIWQLPLYDDLAKGLKSDIADLQNSSPKKFGGTIFAGLFLKEFVNDTPWIHLDIAGPSFFESEHYYMKKGGTGFGVRLLIDFLKKVKV
ncbi:MAG: leucyl aminopeptidase [Candidatus Anammoxibacter sp.]